MTNLSRVMMLALLLFGCGQVENDPPGITDVAWCECFDYSPGCGDGRPSECVALTSPEQLDDPQLACVSAVTYSGPLVEGACPGRSTERPFDNRLKNNRKALRWTSSVID